MRDIKVKMQNSDEEVKMNAKQMEHLIVKRQIEVKRRQFEEIEKESKKEMDNLKSIARIEADLVEFFENLEKIKGFKRKGINDKNYFADE